jgi:two-component system, NtrC family, nitrogen regulation sensor histidine kinase NtrY
MTSDRRPRASWLTFERRIGALALVPAVPALAVGIVLLWRAGIGTHIRWTIIAVLIACSVAAAHAIRTAVVKPMQSAANLIAALRGGDYSMRAIDATPDDALGLLLLETNRLGEQLRSWRLGELEAAALLRTVMAELDVAIFAFDDTSRLRLANRAGERLLGQPATRLLGGDAASLGLADTLAGDVPRVEEVRFPGASGRWGVRRGVFRQDGRQHTLLVLTDLSQALREEQLAAWQRLVRVLSHEINNSLTPIQSIAHTLQALVARHPQAVDSEVDLTRGLEIIAARSEGLARFMSSYAQLARLPAPRVAPLEIAPWIHRTAALESRLNVHVDDGPPTTILGDRDQLDQLLINLVRNAVDAALETRGRVSLGWHSAGDHVDILIEDDGPGLGATTNLFTPFFTTKPDGSGIGLVLSRQIAEAHGGTLTLANRAATRGCIATLRLPTGVGTG